MTSSFTRSRAAALITCAVIATAIVLPACSTARLTQRCTNPQTGISISYPAGWLTNDGDVMPPCSAFDPRAVDLPRESEIPFDIAVTLGVEENPFDPDVASNEWERVVSVEPATVAGRRAIRVETEATGQGLADRGMRSLRYVVDIGDRRTLVASTHDAGREYETNKNVLARMVQTISLP